VPVTAFLVPNLAKTGRLEVRYAAMSADSIPPAPSGTAATQPVSPSVLTPSFVIQSYDDAEWEKFVGEYVGAAQPPYDFIEAKGGAGDKGRDILAHTVAPPGKGETDIYQCKAYRESLMPSDVWAELGKLCVYTFRGDYPVPRRYRFVAPQGVGTSLGDLIAKPEHLRAGLVANWDRYCKDKISSKESYPLQGALRVHVDSFDLTIVGYVPVSALLEQHRRTPYWHQRFKREYPLRPPRTPPPAALQLQELLYVEQLLAAYGSRLKSPVPDIESLRASPALADHFQRCRVDFFMADSLNRFYRDQFPPGAFDHVMNQVYDGVVNVTKSDYADGLARVDATLRFAVLLTLAQTEYTPYVEPGDKKGICHQLANSDRIRWVTL
jgi:hypothetical protein